MSITPNYPCLITSVEPDGSWEGFSATEKIPWLEWEGVSWMRNKAAELSWTVGLEDCGSPPRSPHKKKKKPGTLGQLPKPLPANNMGRKQLQLTRRGEKRKRVIRWPPLWECCKLCFPEALGIPHQSWNLRAWKTGPASPESGDVRCRTTSLDHSVWGSWQWRTFSTVHCASGADWQDRKSKYYNAEDKRSKMFIVSRVGVVQVHSCEILYWLCDRQ